MAKFCGNCGAQLNDDAVFCTSCGASLSASQNAQGVSLNKEQAQPAQGGFSQPAYGQPAYPQQGNVQPNYGQPYQNVQYGTGAAAKKSLSKNAKIMIGVLALLIVALVIVLIVILGGGGKTSPIDNAIKVYEDGSGKALRKTMPSKQVDSLESVYNLVDSDGLDKYFDQMALEYQTDFLREYGSGAKISYEVLTEQELTAADLMEIAEEFTFATSVPKVSEAYNLYIRFDYKGSLKTDTSIETITVAKVDGDWVFADGDDVSDIL